jgi:DNA-binding GntR family transcriptional regulator
MAELIVARRAGPSLLRAHHHRAHAVVRDVLHRCEVWTLLECHAVGRIALSPERDLRGVRAVFSELNQQVLAPSDPLEWQRLELRLHRAIADQAGNPLLGSMLADTCGELEWIRPVQRPGTLWLLQCQHRKILSCLEAGLADEAILHTRVHLHLIRDQLVAALR